MRNTTILEKLLPSILNAFLAISLSLPIFYYFGPGLTWKFSAILIFYLIQVFDTNEHSHFRCFGMTVFGTHWEHWHTRLQRNSYTLLYTLSFSSLFFHVFFPFDLFLFNVLVLQLPSVLLTGTTFHGFVSGNMRTQKPTSKG
jgi:hypothetical protein